MADLSGLSDADLNLVAQGRVGDLSDDGLKILAGEVVTKQEPSKLKSFGKRAFEFIQEPISSRLEEFTRPIRERIPLAFEKIAVRKPPIPPLPGLREFFGEGPEKLGEAVVGGTLESVLNPKVADVLLAALGLGTFAKKGLEAGREVVKTGFRAIGESARGTSKIALPKIAKESLVGEAISSSGEAGEFLKGVPKQKIPPIVDDAVDELIGTKVIAKEGPGSSKLSKFALASTKVSLEKEGPWGAKIAKLLDEQDKLASRKAGTTFSSIRQNLDALKGKGELENLVQVLDEGAAPISSVVGRAATNIRRQLDNMFHDAVESGLIVKERKLSNYFPHFRDPDELANPESLKRILTHKPKVARFGQIEKSRVLDTTEGYEKNPYIVLRRYTEGVYKRATEARFFGPNMERLQPLYNRIRAGGGDIDFVQDVVRRHIGLQEGERTLGTLTKGLTSFQAASKLGLAQLNNLTQTANTAARTSISATSKAIGEFFTNREQAKILAERAGVLLQNAQDALMQSIGATRGSLGAKVLKATYFTPIEEMNRVIAANAGRFYAQDILNKALDSAKRGVKLTDDLAPIRQLKRLGIDAKTALRNGKLSESMLDRAAQNVVQSSQFTGRVLDLPLALTNPSLRFITQFKTFAFQHAKFVKDDIIKEALHGNLKPAGNFLAFGAALGFPTDLVKTWLSGRKREPGKLNRLLDIYGMVGGFGIISDMIRASSQAGIRGQLSMTKFLAGPSISDVAEASTIRKPSEAVKFGIKQIPVIGRIFGQRL